MRCLCLVSVPGQHSSNTSQERSHLLHSRTCSLLKHIHEHSGHPRPTRVEIRAQSRLTMWQWWIVKEPLIKPWLPLVNAGFRFGANDFANKIQIAVLPHLFVDTASLLDGLDFENLSWSQFPTCRDPTKIDDFSEPTTTQMSYTNARAAFLSWKHFAIALIILSPSCCSDNSCHSLPLLATK